MSRRGRKTILLDLRRRAAFETADFGHINENANITDRNGKPLDVDAFIKERTRLYIDTWVLPLIDELIVKEKA